MEKVILNLRLRIRHIIMCEPFFYKAYYSLLVKPRQKNKKLHPHNLSLTSDLDKYVDGYERSGNTFLKFLLVSLFPDNRILSHLHKIGPVKIMVSKAPTFILIRSPLESVTSNYLKHFSRTNLPEKLDENILKLRLHDWVNYYSYIKKNQNRLTIIPFDDLINNTKYILTKFYTHFGVSIPDNFEAKIINLEREFKQGGGAKEKYGRGYPTKEKDLKKSELKVFLTSQSLYTQAMNLYDEIMRVESANYN